MTEKTRKVKIQVEKRFLGLGKPLRSSIADLTQAYFQNNTI